MYCYIHGTVNINDENVAMLQYMNTFPNVDNVGYVAIDHVGTTKFDMMFIQKYGNANYNKVNV